MSSSFLMPSGCASLEPQAAHGRSFFSVRGSIARIRCPANSSAFSCACINSALVNKAVEPQLEHQECPKLMRVITFATNVQIDQLLNGFGFEKTSSQGFFRENYLAQKRLHLATEPVADRNSKTHLASREILAGQQLAQYFFQEILARQSSQLQILRQAGRKLDHLVIQERRSSLR